MEASDLSAQGRVQAWLGIAFITPAAVSLLTCILVPIALTVLLSMTDYKLGNEQPSFVGLDNYILLLRDEAFWRSFANTAIYTGLVVPGSVILSLAFALMINSTGRLKSFYSTAFVMPISASVVAIAVVWEFMLNPAAGLINYILEIFGTGPVNILNQPLSAQLAVAGIGIWQALGFNIVLFLAGLSAIPDDLYDAAALDGAEGSIDRLRLVTLPQLGPTTLFVVMIAAIYAIRVFEVPAVMTQGRPDGATEVLLYTIFVEGFQYFNIGYAAALVTVFLFVAGTLAVLQSRLLERRTHYQ